MSTAAPEAAPAPSSGLAPRWPPSPGPPDLPAPPEIHLWSVALDPGPDRVERLGRFLSAEEHARAGRFRFERDRLRYVVCRGSLRLLLGGYLGVPPGRIRFRLGAVGKPELADPRPDPPLHFNVSHSDDLALVAVRRGGPVGVDVERVLGKPDLPEIAARFFSPAENAELRGVPRAERTLGFYRCWTAKEAVIKCTGEGLTRPLDSFDVAVHPGRPAALLRLREEPDAPDRWTLHALEPAPGFVATVAVPDRAGALRRWHLSPAGAAGPHPSPAERPER